MPINTSLAIVQDPDYIGRFGVKKYGNINLGAQLGIGNRLSHIDGGTPEVLPNLVPVVLSTPTIFDSVPGMSEMFKTIAERLAISWEGLDFEYTAEMQQTVVGHDGQQLSVHTQTRRSQLTPSLTAQEVKGMLLWNFFRKWINMSKDADTQAAMTHGSLGSIEDLEPLTISSTTADILWIQYDSTYRYDNVLAGFVTMAMFPNTSSMAGWKRTVGDQQGFPQRSIPFSCVLQHNDNTNELARDMARLLRLHAADYNLAQPASDRVSTRLRNMGIQEEIQYILKTHQVHQATA